MRPVEQMVDAAIDRLAREQGSTPTPISEPAYPLAKPMKPTRLRWKGLEVSEEFKAYAERVARGEDLPPFQGRVLAEPNAAFPWGGVPALPAAPPARASGAPRAALLGTAVLMVGLLGWSIAMKLETAPGDVPYGASSAGMDAIGDSIEQTEPLEPSLAAPPDPRLDVLPRSDLPHDVVDTASLGTAAGGPALQAPPAASAATPLPLAEPAAVGASPTATQPSAAAPASLAPTPSSPVPAGTAAAPPAVAAPPALEAAPARPAPSNAVSAPPVRPAEPARVPPKAVEDDFGLDELAPPPVAPSAPKAANAGDTARSAPGSGASVRKEPGSESSAKGSLLVENPSF